ncbi:PfkB family carbohydrate kinase [Rathayibacter sp. VKM Ac-2754]|uniref:PfkB family carbohydrate kinase n=1 Tax=Rathayibacter sp. VKM Ac-2754 TaxID=2609251 RepID=UPI0022856F18|nr:PfkB family carbohydrate kinase [Rathayibacter sp. VKM Ac-2754]
MSLVVLGSANLDHVHRVARIPAPGETVLALDYRTYPGGKGLNQAVAAARTAPGTAFVTSLGRDAGGDELATVLAGEPLALHAGGSTSAPGPRRSPWTTAARTRSWSTPGRTRPSSDSPRASGR